MVNNSNLHAAKSAKNDEFYTQLSDVEKEMNYYKDFFRGKKVLCNCNDDTWSSFFKYFSTNFENLELAKLTCVSYNEKAHGVKYVFDNDQNIAITELNGHGDFRDDECRELLEDSDVVITNPPFSLFRDFITLMMKFNKKFLVIGNTNAITYKQVFPYIMNNKIWLGCSSFNSGVYFNVPEEYEYSETYNFNKFIDGRKVMRVSSICWFTNIEHSKRHLPLDLYKHYNSKDYPKYDNYDAIECSKTLDIPIQYYGVIGVPITFFDKYCPDQFEILGCSYQYGDCGKHIDGTIWSPMVNNKNIYKRIFIRRKK